MPASRTLALLCFLLSASRNAHALVAFPVATLSTGLALLDSGVNELPTSPASSVDTDTVGEVVGR